MTNKTVWVVFSDNAAYGQNSNDISVFATKEAAEERFNMLKKRAKDIADAEGLEYEESVHYVCAFRNRYYCENHYCVNMSEKIIHE